MELDFDKEIDALLRQTVKSDAAFANGNPQTAHLDADEISAFAENALPEKAKQRLTAHFADCDSCRKNLSELILLNGENEVETVEEEKAAVIAPAIPWYRKLFVFPNLAYTMGALVLTFTGLTAFIVLQNFTIGNSEVATSKNTSIDRAGSAPVQNEEQMSAATNANSAASNTATAANTNSAANLSPQSSPEVLSNTALQSKSEDKTTASRDLKQTDQPRSETDSDLESPGENKPKTNEAERNQPENKSVGGKPPISADPPTIAGSQAAPPPSPVQEKRKTLERAKPKKSEVLVGRGSDEKVKDDTKIKEEAQDASLSSARRFSGKTFNRKDGVWYDSAYRNQPTTNVRRGTNEYQKLDSGLRSIGNQLDGVVVVIWKTKAYRIE
jgi:hypothetical protein